MEDGYMKGNSQSGARAENGDTLRKRILGLRSKCRLAPNSAGFTSGSGESQTEDSEFSSSEVEEQNNPQAPNKSKLPNSNAKNPSMEAIGKDTTYIPLPDGAHSNNDDSSTSSEDEIEMTSELEDPPGRKGMYSVNPGDDETSDPSSSDSDSGESIQNNQIDSMKTPTRSLSGSSETLEEDAQSIVADPLVFPSPPNTVDGEEPFQANNQPAEPIPIVDAFSSSSSSDSEGDEDNKSPRVIKGKDDIGDDNDLTPLSLRKALEERERNLKENDPDNIDELGARKPSEPEPGSATPDFMEPYSPEAFDFTGDPSLRARTAFDFEDEPQIPPPSLPPKQRDVNPPNVQVARRPHGSHSGIKSKVNHPEEQHPNIFHVKDKIASLGRGMWSDEDDDFEPYRKNTSMPNRHPEPDRIIDFSKNPDGDHSLKRSRSERRKQPTGKRPKSRIQSRSRSPNRSGHRVLDFSGNPYIDPHNGINAQAMVSLHSNRPDTDAYDTVKDSEDELDNLIDQANSLGYHHNYLKPSEDIYQRITPKEKKLASKHPEAFAKIVAPMSSKPAHRPPTYRTNSNPENSRKSSRNQTRRYRRAAPPMDADDETSVTESDMERLASHSRDKVSPMSVPFVTAVYPSSHTEFESYSEADFADSKKYDRTSSFVSDNTTRGIYRPNAGAPGKYVYNSPAHQTLEMETEEEMGADLNPIVSSNFRICSDVAASKSFPARIRENPRKQRPTLEHVAIPLNQASKNRQAYPTSLPYFGNEFDSDYDGLKRSGSVDDVYPIHQPSIVVHRQPMRPRGYEPEVVPAVLVQSNPYSKKEKKKKEKKEPVEKAVPQINLKVDGEPSNINNNLQINLLPSDDPNIINLNIRSSSVNPTGPQSLPLVSSPTETKEAIVPQPASLQSDSQHRVVDVTAPAMVYTGNNDTSPASYSENGGVLLAGGVPTEILPPPQNVAAPQIAPTISFGPSQVYPQLPATYSLPVAASMPQPAAPLINTHVSTPAPAQQPPPQINDEPTIVNVEAPRPTESSNRNRSLPENRKSHERIYRGDSGIDLTMFEHRRSRRHRKRRRSASRSSSRRPSTVASSDRGSKRRSSSKRHLKSHDYLGGMAPTREYMEWYKDKYLKPSCCYLIMKHFMIAVNMLFLLAGLGLVGLGIWGMVGLHQAGISDADVIAMDPLFPVMLVGLITSLVSFHGAAGFIRDNICMIRSCGILLITLFMIFVVGGIIFWAMLDQVNNFIVETATSLIQQYDPETRVGLSFLINFVQETFSCCGITERGDWVQNEIFKCNKGERCFLPDSCCATTLDPDFNCRVSSELSHQLTCNIALANTVRNNTPIIVGAWIGIWVLMMIELVFIYFMCKEVRYLQKVRNFTDNPIKYMEKAQRKSSKADAYDEGDSSQESSEEDTETSSSEEEYRRKRKNRRHADRSSSRGRKKKRNHRSDKRSNKRSSSYANKGFSIHDETRFNRTRSHRDSRHRKRSRSRRRDSF